MRHSLASAVVVAVIAAGVAVAGPSEGIAEPEPVWASGTDASPEGDPMEPRIVERPELVLVGIVASAPDVNQMDFHGIWQRFQTDSENIKHQVEGAAYELHVQTEAEPATHFSMAGVEVTDVEDLPAEMFVKVLPACTYAVFTLRFVDGFGQAYERIWGWLAESPYTTDPYAFDIQRYGSRFTGPEDPESEVDIYVPVRLE